MLVLRSAIACAFGLWVATHTFAHLVSDPRSLGVGLEHLYGITMYAPYEVVVWLWKWLGLLHRSDMLMALAAGVMVTGVCMAWIFMLRRKDEPASSHGTSRWATAREVRRLGN